MITLFQIYTREASGRIWTLVSVWWTD